ncbi:MAG: hypothetical protein WDN27_04220 [Candidatus Saccharibacteria bacterium]
MYKYATNVQISGTVPSGSSVTVVVTGTGHYAYIGGNIDYVNTSDSFANIGAIPRLNVYVQNGDIRVLNTVDHIHGFFVAEGSGVFYSCVDNTQTPIPLTGTNDYNNCNHELSVYGSASASKFILHRTYGQLTAGSPPAERFIYDPELWLAQPGAATTNNLGGYDAITSLPPVL